MFVVFAFVQFAALGSLLRCIFVGHVLFAVLHRGILMCVGCALVLRAVAAARVRETLTLLEGTLHGLTLTAHLPHALATPIIGLVMGVHDVVQEGDIIST